jgi:hypothetical protein
MTASKSPSTRWSQEHGGRRRGPGGERAAKICHDSPESAQQHADEVNARCLYRGHVYSCRWGDRYETGEIHAEHWHVGRNPGVIQ